ncbi:MAG: biotin carboxylase [Actinobacteria bacterium]|nr:biotin carboxylase [Actinomycetota bacterium]
MEPVTVPAPMAATISMVHVAAGQAVTAGQTLVVLEVMKMEHLVAAPTTGHIVDVAVAVGDQIEAGAPLCRIRADDTPSVPGEPDATEASTSPDALEPDAARGDLANLERARTRLTDEARPEAVAKIRARGRRTARENIADLCDPDSFDEYGGFAYAAQERRRSRDDLDASTPADGLVTGIGRINGNLFDHRTATCAIAAYDYSVLAGTQGWRNHHKKDRLFEIAEKLRAPVVLFAEGGGGRPGDVDVPVVAGLDTRAFELFARLSGQVPTIGIASGRCFAGNAALLGCCDVIIATADATIGMAGPAMIEGGGLGRHRPEDIGPVDVQTSNGVIDIAVDDDAGAVDAAKRYLSYFQGSIDRWTAPDQTRLRTIIPENRKRIYSIRSVITGLADVDSCLELRRSFGTGMVTTLARLQGAPVGILANDPAHLGGAIDRDAADKAARFLGLCDTHGLPVLYLCDTPGFMVGPDAERTAQVRHFARMFVTAAAMRVPFGTVALRKGFGLGAQAMAGGSFQAGLFTLSWPSGVFGGMGLEGAVRLGFRKELEAIDDPERRQQTFEAMVAAAYDRGSALNMAAHLEVDDVIDPAETRARVVAAFTAAGEPERPPRRFVDPW